MYTKSFVSVKNRYYYFEQEYHFNTEIQNFPYHNQIHEKLSDTEILHIQQHLKYTMFSVFYGTI